jgi:hypothetical protein
VQSKLDNVLDVAHHLERGHKQPKANVEVGRYELFSSVTQRCDKDVVGEGLHRRGTMSVR